MTGDSEKGTEKKPENFVDKMDDKKMDNAKSSASGDSPISDIISNLKKFALADDINPESSDNSKKPEYIPPEKTKSSHEQGSSKNSDKKDGNRRNDTKEDHAFHFTDLIGQDSLKSLKTRKDRIIKGTAIFIGGLLILYGLILISASVTRVADNVIFGEKAMLSTFLILLGVLIIVAAYAQRILNRTFLNKIHTELEVAEGRSESEDNSRKIKDENGNKVDKDNKDNIVGENKGNQGG